MTAAEDSARLTHYLQIMIKLVCWHTVGAGGRAGCGDALSCWCAGSRELFNATGRRPLYLAGVPAQVDHAL
jgi:hypothetical protein